MVNFEDYFILLAEDNNNLRERFRELLSNKGFKVEALEDGLKLYERCVKYVLDNEDLDRLVIISDTDMPLLCGDETCERLLKEFDEFNRVMIIGMSDNSANENYWKGVGIRQTFIYKGDGIDKEGKNNLAEKLANRINMIETNPVFYGTRGRFNR